MNKRLSLALLLTPLLLFSMATPAQEEQPVEKPDPGFHHLGPRTVISFVRQTLPGAVPTAGPQVQPVWNTVIHLSNTGNAALAAAAIFVSEEGAEKRALRLGGIRPGQTMSVSVAGIIGADLTNLPDVARGVVILRFFAPDRQAVDGPALRFFSQMVTAESTMALPGTAPQMIPLDVERPGLLFSVGRRSFSGRR